MYDLFLGIDIAKEEHYFSIVDSQGKILVDGEKIVESIEGHLSFIKSINDIIDKQGRKREIKIAVAYEGTGGLEYNLINTLFNSSLPLFIFPVNSLKTFYYSKSRLPRNKNDKISSCELARYLRERVDECHQQHPDLRHDLMQIVYQLNKLNRKKNMVNNQLKQKLHVSNHEVLVVLGNLTPVVLELLVIAPTADDIAKMDPEKISQLKSRCLPNSKRIQLEKAKKLVELSAKSISGRTLGIDRVIVKQYAQEMLMLETQIKECENIIDDLLIASSNPGDKIKDEVVSQEKINSRKKTLHKLCIEELSPKIAQMVKIAISIKGVGKHTGLYESAFAAVHETIDRKKIVSLAGLAPIVNNSGTSVETCRLSKYGSPVGRSLLYQCAKAAAKSNQVFKLLFQIYLYENKFEKKKATIALTVKILRILCGMWKSGSSFDEDKVYKNIISHHRTTLKKLIKENEDIVNIIPSKYLEPKQCAKKITHTLVAC